MIPTPPERSVLFINPASGDGRAVRTRLAEHAGALGIECVVLERGADLGEMVRQAAAGGAGALGMAGGDGSMATVAAVASARGLPFVCVPTGTRNHFARDLGIPPDDPVAALAAFTTGDERRVDLAEVNGQEFVNNVSMGVYGDAVQDPGYRAAKLRILIDTAREVLGPAAATPPLRLVDDGGREHAHPAVLLVSNNPYALEPGVARGSRRRLDGGHLGVVVLDRPAPPRRVGAHAWTARRLDVVADGPVYAGRDGEAVTLHPPLRFASSPGALLVRLPPRRQLRPRPRIAHPA